MAGAKKSTTTEKPSGPKDSKKNRKDKVEGGIKKSEITVVLTEQQAMKVIQNSKVITIHDLARQTGVKISAANAFLKQLAIKGTVKKVGGYSGHYLYQVVSS
ncbi:MAG: MarR family transcriptional regulator [Crenarchaeota archaeon]|nr:MarR family transcriptional regulator [Thermoproteota archaeon]HJJ21166.1 MarR family transcriptional regulator [Nitrosopumilus sp.]MDA0853881.1 MarR family transcriptional regulator [Thermoproteota archaeon]MDA1123129.1 MarR family transcriptional regulator [Thermoproteota archaeon]HJJ24609.1 MarR family transcriptional regulator [Nitrosopumilus sp.]